MVSWVVWVAHLVWNCVCRVLWGWAGGSWSNKMHYKWRLVVAVFGCVDDVETCGRLCRLMCGLYVMRDG